MDLGLLGRAGRRDNRTTADLETWVDREAVGCEFGDARLGKRFRTLLERIKSDIGKVPHSFARIGRTRRRRTVFRQSSCQRSRHSVGPFPVDA